MAKPEHLAILRQGVIAWNKWREENPGIRPDLGGAGLNTDTYNLHNFDHANFREANLAGTEIWSGSLNSSDFSDANLSETDLYLTELVGADLRGTRFDDARLRFINIAEANLSQSHFERTDLLGIDLSQAMGLAETIHAARISIDVGVFELTAQGLSHDPSRKLEVEQFYRFAGVPEHLIEYYSTRIGQPIEFYSAFISYSHQDKAFARKLYEALRREGLRCWLDEKQMLPGDDIYDQVDRAIRLWDKILLCCSSHSLSSWWVDNDIGTAFEKEQHLTKERGKKVQAIIPLDLDGFLFGQEFARGYRAELRRRLAAAGL
jgi:hypothetical protein